MCALIINKQLCESTPLFHTLLRVGYDPMRSMYLISSASSAFQGKQLNCVHVEQCWMLHLEVSWVYKLVWVFVKLEYLSATFLCNVHEPIVLVIKWPTIKESRGQATMIQAYTQISWYQPSCRKRNGLGVILQIYLLQNLVTWLHLECVIAEYPFGP